MKNLNIPVGVSDFAEIRKNDYYYVDKTGLITEFLKTPATKVTLITRPRRFGKTLGMSMLENFFDIRKDSQELFAGLHISKCALVCQSSKGLLFHFVRFQAVFALLDRILVYF